MYGHKSGGYGPQFAAVSMRNHWRHTVARWLLRYHGMNTSSPFYVAVRGLVGMGFGFSINAHGACIMTYPDVLWDGSKACQEMTKASIVETYADVLAGRW